MTLPLEPTIGMRVLAARDACHASSGAIDYLPDVAPVAIVRFDCGCRAYVPLRRLNPEPTPGGKCQAGGCRNPEWPVGSGMCFRHNKIAARMGAAYPAPVSTPGVGREQPFDSEARPGHAGTSARQPRTGRAVIDGRGTKAAEAPHKPGEQRPPRVGQHAAGRMAGRGTGVPRPAPAGGGSVGDRRRFRVVGGTAAGRPPVASPAVAAAARRTNPKGGRGHTTWTWEGCIAAAHHFRRCRGRWPQMRDWVRQTEESPANTRVVKLFGGWLPFAAEIGFEPRHRKDWTAEQVLTAFRRYFQEEGRSPSTSRCEGAARLPYMPSPPTVAKLFGSFSAGLVAAELPPNPVGRPRMKAAA